MFLREGQRAEAATYRTWVPLIRVAVNGESKDVKDLLEGLGDG